MIVIDNLFEIISSAQLQEIKDIHKKEKENIGISVKGDYLGLYSKLIKKYCFIKIINEVKQGIKLRNENLELTFDNFMSFPSIIRKQMVNDSEYLLIMLKKVLKESRYLHSLSVALVASSLAKCHHLNEDEAYIAGVLHDTCKYLSKEDTEKYLKYYDEDKLNYPEGTKHSFVAKYYLKEKLNLHNSRIINAIYNHTVCHSNDKLSKILFIADKREPLRGLGNDIIELAKTDLDKAYSIINIYVEDYLRGKNE